MSQLCSPSNIIILCGNKTDLIPCFSAARFNFIARNVGASYCECCCRFDQNMMAIYELLEAKAKQIEHRDMLGTYPSE